MLFLENKKMISLRVSLELHSTLERIAETENRTIPNLVYHATMLYVKSKINPQHTQEN